MREILFRGKRLGDGEWVEGFYSPVKLPIFGEMGHFINEGGYKAVEIDPSTVGQFTGLLDKNGKRIFEGDIVEGDWAKGVVKFLEGTFDSGIYRYNGWVIERDDGDVDHRALVRGSEAWMDPVVLGNIHDNPELMEVNEDG